VKNGEAGAQAVSFYGSGRLALHDGMLTALGRAGWVAAILRRLSNEPPIVSTEPEIREPEALVRRTIKCVHMFST
jgi:hypothetical protein